MRTDADVCIVAEVIVWRIKLFFWNSLHEVG